MGIWDKRTKIMGRMEVWEGRKCGEKRNARNVGAVARKEVGVKEGNMGREGNCKIFRIFFRNGFNFANG